MAGVHAVSGRGRSLGLEAGSTRAEALKYNPLSWSGEGVGTVGHDTRQAQQLEVHLEVLFGSVLGASSRGCAFST